MNGYSVGATWEGNDKEGHKARIWLNEIHDGQEIWHWWSTYPTAFPNMGWGTSYQMCKDSLPFDCRMKRVK